MSEPYDDGKTDALIASTNNMIGDDWIRSFGHAGQYHDTAQEAADAAMAEPTEGDEISVVDDDGVEHPVDESEAVQLLSQWQAEDELAKGNVDPYLRNLAREGQGDATAAFFDRTLHELGYDKLAEAAQAEVDAEDEPGEPGQP